ncbi:hypothetical protein PISL3812_06380 [Talaromyces islandicus]|uniref:Rhodopsin domain-containing protein n=1 Tax=Talaromyces islandicus TaxID=28573 RepID=A0A0U1M1H3_TALIS|nr:hypothetical protein PISL3812_06380 [Talaromyces islandicus]
MSFPPGFAENFKRETWILYGVGMASVALRYVARIRRLGINNLQKDDFIMMFGVIWYTILCVALNEVASGGGSNLMTAEDKANMTPSIHAERVRGSKWVFVSEHAFILTVWSFKSCMLVIYARITDGLAQKRLINYCAIYVALGFVGTELALFLTCIPLSNYWAAPTPNPQCSTYQHYEIIQGCFSITADVFMLAVAIPLLLKIRLPTKQKMILVILFGMGIFVIVSAILTKVYCLVPHLISYVYMNWYFREATVAILVTNIPLVWSLLRDVFPSMLRSWTGGSKKGTDRYYPSAPWSNTKSRGSRGFGVASHVRSMPSHHDIEEMGPMPQKEDSSVSISQRSGDSPNSISDDGSARALRIRQEITVTVEEEARRDSKFITSTHGWSDSPQDSRKRSSA